MKPDIKAIFSSDRLQKCFDNPNFKTDKCSGGLSKTWKFLFKKDCPYNPYCIDHDCMYFLGTQGYEGIFGEITERFKADWKLAKNIWNNDENWYDKPMAIIVFIAVRIGGSRVWIFNSFRWQYGISVDDKLSDEANTIKDISNDIKKKLD